MHLATVWREKFSVLFSLTEGNKSSFNVGIYSETVYHGFVCRESKRSERSGHLCRILLVYHTNTQRRVVPFGSEIADKTISVLSGSIRDTDYIGWYGQGRILGVLLTALRPDSAEDGYDNLKARVMDSLRGTLIFTDDHSLQIRMFELSNLTTFNASDHSVPSPGFKD